MPDKEATARIKINKLLEAAGDNFEKTTKGFVDFLLLDARGFPLLV